ncbi:MAG: ABC transporter permease, partial [Candidatus Gastranaerophilaceae bacterium]
MFNKSKYPDNLTAFCFLFPCLIGTLIFIIIPVFASFGLSFFEWNLLTSPKYVGIANYIELF